MNPTLKMLLFVIPATLSPVVGFLLQQSTSLSAQQWVAMILSALVNGCIAIGAFYATNTARPADK